MSLVCYDFQKWTIISLTSVAISLTIGLVLQHANAYIDPERYKNDPALYYNIPLLNQYEQLLNYCYEHASDSPNPIQDLVDKGLIDATQFQGKNCKIIKNSFTNLDQYIAGLIRQHYHLR